MYNLSIPLKNAMKMCFVTREDKLLKEIRSCANYIYKHLIEHGISSLRKLKRVCPDIERGFRNKKRSVRLLFLFF